MSTRVRVMAVVGVALVALLASASAVSATEGSVPVEVTDFAAAPDGLIAGLDEFFGPGAGGKGLDFDDTTEFGTIDRVFTFTPDWLAGKQTDKPVGLANEWTVPVSLGGDAIGVAVLWINPETVRPQLADFVPDAVFATALAAAPDDGFIVSDEDRGAWFVLQQPRLLVLVGGTSGVGSQVPLASYQESVTASPVTAQEPADLGSALSVGIIGAVALIVIVVLLVPAAWRRRRERADSDEAEPDEPELDEPEVS